MTENSSVSSAGSPGKKTAGLFDIRNIIGALLGIYGIALLLAGMFMDTAPEKTGGVNANLWTGLGLAAAAAAFLLWSRIRPTVVPDEIDPADDDPTRPAPRRTRPH